MSKIKPILIWPHSILKKQTQNITDFSKDSLQNLLEILQLTLIAAKGLGLAAPQINDPRSIFLAMIDNKPVFFINPKVVGIGNKKSMKEGCLSLPGEYGSPERYEKVSVLYQNITGTFLKKEFIGQNAQIIQHEDDHLHGIVYCNRLTNSEKGAVEKRMKLLRRNMLSWQP